MKKIIVDSYLEVKKDLIGSQINLTKPNSILLFFEICRIKQSKIKAMMKYTSINNEDELVINKKKLESILDKSIIKQNRDMIKIIDDFKNGVYFINKNGEIIEIIKYLEFDSINGDIIISFNEDNFINNFIKINNNFTKLPLEYFKNLKSKNVFMILLYIMKYSDMRNVFISENDLLFLLEKTNISNSHLNQTLKRIIGQLSKIELLEKINIDKNKNNNYNIKFECFSINKELSNKIKNIKEDKNIKEENSINVENLSDSELAIYCD